MKASEQMKRETAKRAFFTQSIDMREWASLGGFALLTGVPSTNWPLHCHFPPLVPRQSSPVPRTALRYTALPHLVRATWVPDVRRSVDTTPARRLRSLPID